jgi:hypothetical protein
MRAKRSPPMLNKSNVDITACSGLALSVSLSDGASSGCLTELKGMHIMEACVNSRGFAGHAL